MKRQAILLKNRLRVCAEKAETGTSRRVVCRAMGISVSSTFYIYGGLLLWQVINLVLGSVLHLSGIRKISNFIFTDSRPCILIPSKWIILTDLNAQRPDPLDAPIADSRPCHRKAWYFQWHIHNHQDNHLFAGQTTRETTANGRVYEPSR